MQTIIKTKVQLKALQTKAETLIQTLDKEVIVITGGKQHIDVKPGNAYELNVKDDNVLNKDFNSIAKKVGDDLEVLLSNNATVVFNGYFKICTSDLSCLVSLPAEGGVYHVVEGNFVTLSDGSKIVYSYGDEATLTSITSSQSSLFTDIFNEVYLSDGFSLAGVGGALAAVGLLANAGTTNNTMIPTIAITSDANSLKAGQTAIITFTLSEVSTDFTAADVEVTGGRLSDFAPKAGEAKVYTATFIPTKNSTIAGEISVASDKFSDAAGNHNADGSDNSLSLTVDTILPTIAITSDANSLKAGQTAIITFTLSEVSTDFTAADVEVTGGRLSDFAPKAGEAKVYTATFTSTGTIASEISVASDKFTDTAGNNNVNNSVLFKSIVFFDTDISMLDLSVAGIKKIKIVLTGNALNTVNDKLVLGNAELALNDTNSDKFKIEVSGVKYEYSYDYNHTTKTLFIFKNDGGNLLVADVEKIGGVIKLKNATDTLNDGERTATISYIDAFFNEGAFAIATIYVNTNDITVTITSNAGDIIKQGDIVTYTFVFSEDVDNFVKGDIVVAGGEIKGDLMATHNNKKIYKLTVIPKSHSTEDMIVTVTANSVQGVNSAIVETSALGQEVNTNDITVTITSNAGDIIKQGDIVTYTFVFSEDVDNFVKGDIVVAGGEIKGDLMATHNNKKIYKLTVIPKSHSTEDMIVTVTANSVQGVNSAIVETSALGQEVNTNDITVTITSNAGDIIKQGETVTYTFVFSEDVDNFVKGDIVVAGGEIKGDLMATHNNKKIYKLTVIPKSHSTEDMIVTVTANSVQGVNSAIVETAASGQEVNTNDITVTITSNAEGTTIEQNEIITYTFVFSEDVDNFVKGDIVVAGGEIKGDLMATHNNKKIYKLTVIPKSHSTEDMIVTVTANSVQGVNSAIVETSALGQEVNTNDITVTITSNAGDIIKQGETVTYTFVFSEDVDNFVKGDIVVAGGEIKGDLMATHNNKKIYKLTVIPKSHSTEDMIVTVTANSVQGVNSAIVETAASGQEVNTNDITVTITSNAGDIIKQGDIVTYTFVFSEDVDNFVKGDIVVAGGEIKGDLIATHNNKKIYKLTVIPKSHSTEDMIVTVTANSVQGVNSAIVETAASGQEVNTNDITVTITSNAGDIIKQGDIVTYTFVFSEDVDNFVKGDIVVAGGEIKGDLIATHNNKKIYKLTVIPKSHSTEDMIVTVTANSVQGVNSAIVETAASGQEVNTNDITVTITSNAGDIIKQGETVTYTFVFSEDVDNFVKGDIVVAGGEIKGDLMATHNNKKIYKLTVIPKSHSTEDMIVTVTANSVQGVNSAIVETAASGQEVNTNDITVTITSNAGDIIKQGDIVTYTFVFSEDVDNFVKGDIVVAGGEIKGDLIATHNNKKIYKLTVIPKSHSTEDMIVTVTANSVQGVNSAIVETAASGQEVNTNDITVTITSNAGDIIKQGDIVTYTFVFSEDVDNFVKGDIVVAGGEIKGDLIATHNNKKIYKLTVIPKSHSTEDMIVTVTANSVQGVNGAIVETAASGQEVNTNDITVTITSNAGDIIKQGDIVTYTFVFSEDVDNFVKGDIVVAGGEIKGDLMATHNNKKIYKLTVIPKSHSTEDMIVTVTANSVQGVNSAIVETAASGQEVNTNDITVTITSNAGDIIKQGDIVTYTFVFSEDVDNFVKGDIVVAGGEIKGDLIATHNNKKIYKLTVIPKSHSTEDMIVTVTANSVQGVNGAIVETAASGQEVNTNDITVTITSNAGDIIKQGDIVTYTFVFSEDVDNFVKGDIVVAGGEIKGDLIATHNNKKIYKLTVIPKSHSTEDMIVTVTANSVQGVNGAIVETAASGQEVNTNDITVTITSNAGDIIKQGDIVTYTFVFSEDVDNFVKGDIVVAGGEIKGDLMATHNNKKIYKLTVIPKSHSTEDMIVTVTANSVQGVNSAIVETAASGQEVNTNDITVTITSNAGDIIKQGDIVTYTFVFSEDVDNFVKGDIVVAGGEIKGDLIATHNNKKIYKLTVIPKSHSTEDMIVTVTANSVQGVNGAIVETAASGQEVNTNDITVTITSNAGDIIKQGDIVTYTFVFSEDVDNFVKGDIVVAGGEIKGDLIATHNNKKIYKLTVIPKSHSTEDMIVTVTANSVQGVNSAIVETAASGQEVNTNDITVTITSNAGDIIKQGETVTYTFVFSEDVDNFVKGDIVVAGGEIKGDLMATHNNKKIYKLTVIPKSHSTEDMIVTVTANSVQGVNGAIVETAASGQEVNTNDITVTITSNAGDIIKQGETVTYTFVFSEDVDNFVKGDIVVAGGEIKGDLMATHNNKKIYKLTVIPKSHSTEDMIVTVTANSVQGVNGAIVETAASGQEVNTNDITVTITSNAGDIIKQGETVTYTFVFSEDVDNFVKGDIVVAGGEIKGDLMATHNNKKIYKLTVIPKSHSTEDMIVTVTANSVQGVNGAIVETAASGQEVNTNDITVTITSNAGDIIKQGETVTYTFVFSEDVDNFVKGDIVVAGGEIKGDLMATHNNKKIYKLTVIPKSHSTEDMIVTVTANSVQGVNGAIVETAASGQEVNTNDITVTITSNAEGTTIEQNAIITYTFVFSEDVDNFVKGDIVVGGGEIKGDLMATHNNKKIYKLTVTPKLNITGEMIVIVAANSVQGVHNPDATFGKTIVSDQKVSLNAMASLQGDNGVDDDLFGAGISEYIAALGGNDILTGNAGNDILIGGRGTNTFKYTAITDGHDTIMDFKINEDKLDFSELFSGTDITFNLSRFIRVTDNNGSAPLGDIVLWIDVDGDKGIKKSGFISDITVTLREAGLPDRETTLDYLMDNHIILL